MPLSRAFRQLDTAFNARRRSTAADEKVTQLAPSLLRYPNLASRACSSPHTRARAADEEHYDGGEACKANRDLLWQQVVAGSLLIPMHAFINHLVMGSG